MIVYKFTGVLARVEERFDYTNWRKEDDKVYSDKTSIGWYIVFKDSWLALYVGREEPVWRAGQKVSITVAAEET